MQLKVIKCLNKVLTECKLDRDGDDTGLLLERAIYRLASKDVHKNSYLELLKKTVSILRSEKKNHLHDFSEGLRLEDVFPFVQKVYAYQESIDNVEERCDSMSDKKSRRLMGLQCKSCKSTDIAWVQKQTRSSDEGMTTICTCRACDSTFKMN